jgi:predicted GH43/DUF377 family glycosyl hydrolase
MLLDAADPARVLRHSIGPILSPTEPYERGGFVPDVVFPTGTVERGDALSVYYGAGDTHTAVAETSLSDLIEHLQPLD